MLYAQPADIAEIYGAEQLARLTDTDGDGISENSSIVRALEFAGAQIDSYIGARYALPLPATPVLIKMLAIDIAVYRIAQDNTRLTDEIAKRYDDAVRQLKDIGAGRSVLPVPVAGGEGNTAAPSQMIVVTEAADRVFDRAALRRL